MSTLIDETGKRYGSLVVVRKVPTGGARGARWLCRCDCGKECVVLGVHLRHRAHRRRKAKGPSCGCARAAAMREVGPREPVVVGGVQVPVVSPGGGYVYDLTGQRFGSYTVVRFDRKHVTAGGSVRTMWLCRCDCGVEKAVSANHLLHEGSRWCRDCRPSHAVPEEQRVCRWCERSTRAVRGNSPARECAACNRAAHRNGRDSDGRPLSRGKRRVMQEAS